MNLEDFELNTEMRPFPHFFYKGIALCDSSCDIPIHLKADTMRQLIKTVLSLKDEVKKLQEEVKELKNPKIM